MTESFSLLHGEDDVPDIDFIKMVLSEIGYCGHYQSFDIGQDVLDYVFFQGEYSDSHHRLPDLVLLDIGLPGTNGKEILRQMRRHDKTSHIPIIIMSGSISLRDYNDCISLGCNGYLQKNEPLDWLMENCQLVLKSWINLSKQSFI